MLLSRKQGNVTYFNLFCSVIRGGISGELFKFARKKKIEIITWQ